jgi:tetratricopeptide (TPR) repeat protein
MNKAAIDQLAVDFADHPTIRETVVELYYDAGLAEATDKICRELLAEEPGNRAAFFRLVHLRRLAGKREEADQMVARYAQEHPSLAGNRALASAAAFYFDRREYDRAAEFMDAKKWTALDTWQGDTILTLGKLKWANGKYKEAMAEFERCFQRYGMGSGPAHIGRFAALADRWEEMRRQGDRILSRTLTNMDGYWIKGLYYLHQGNIAEGEKTIIMGRANLSHAPRGFELLAAWWFHTGNFQGGIQLCEGGRKYVWGPTHDLLDRTEFRLRLIAGDVEGAGRVVARMKLYEPFSPRTFVNEALWHLARNEIPAARAAIDTARLYNPRDTFTQVAHGRVLLAEGKTDEAVQELYYAATHVHFPSHWTEAYFYLAKAHEAAGQATKARETWEKLLALWPAGYWADQARAGLGR